MARALPPLPADAPLPGSHWRHHRGGSYRVQGMAWGTLDDEWLVLYAATEGTDNAGVTFARPLRQWQEPVDHDGHMVQRFVAANA